MSQTKSVLRIKSTYREKEEELDKLKLVYGITDTKFGRCLIALKEDHVCFLSFFDDEYSDGELKELQKLFPKALLFREDNVVVQLTKEIFDGNENIQETCKVALVGTDFQQEVWEYLLKTKKGATMTYEDVAKGIGRPQAVRAVANAIAKNNIAYIVPCHRIISKTGKIGKFRWGLTRKQEMLREEEKK